MDNDTIVAISTPLGEGAIAIIRLSGINAIKIVNSIFHGPNLLNNKSHTIHYGKIIDKKEIIDEVLVMIMKKPKTYTKENIVEINCHGSISTTTRILELILLNGARLAQPGEFTKRAFLNGRIDLINAEGIMDIISSKTEKARKLAINEITGNVTKIIKNIRKQVLELLANIEVNIDYPEYKDIEEITIQKIKKEISIIKKHMIKALKEAENSKIIKEGINVLILGRTNVGKSSLLNVLLNEEKAIVTNIGGTTRDIVEGNLLIEGIKLNLIDTAGIRSTRNIIEQKGIEKTKKLIGESDLILLVLDGSKKIKLEDKKLLKLTNNMKRIIVVNKQDLNIKTKLKEKNICISTKTQKGIDDLKEEIKNIFNLGGLNDGDVSFLATARQTYIIKEILEIIVSIEKGINNNLEIDIIEIDIKKIWNKLGEIIGETYDDELIDQLFSQFCLGK